MYIERNFCHNCYPFTSLGMHRLSIWQCGIDSSILMFISQFVELAGLCLVYLINNMPSESFNWNTCWSNQNQQLLQLLKTGLFFWHKLLKESFFWHGFMLFFNPANHIRIFSVILESDMDPQYMSLNIESIPIGRYSNQRFSSMCILYNLRKSVYLRHSTKVVVVYSGIYRGIFILLSYIWAIIFEPLGRWLLLTVSYAEVYLYH